MATLIPPGPFPERARVLLNSILAKFGVNLAVVSATYDPPSLAAGAVASIQTQTVTGATVGDFVKASFSQDLAGARLDAWVSAADTVKFRFANPTAGTIDLASGTVRLRVEQA